MRVIANENIAATAIRGLRRRTSSACWMPSIVARTGQGAFRSLPMTEFACDLFPRAWEFRTGVTERRGSDDCFTVSKMDRADVACHGAGARRCPRARSTERVRGSKSAQRGTGTGPRPGSGGGHPDSARSTSAQRRAGPRHRGRVSIRLPRQPRQYRSARPLHPDDQARPLRAHAGLRDATYGPVETVADRARQRVTLTGARETMTYWFYLSRQSEPPYVGCWMTDSVFIEPTPGQVA